MNITISIEILGEPLTILVTDGNALPIYEFKTLETDTTLSLSICLNDKEYEISFLTNTVNTISYEIKMGISILRTEKLLTFDFSHKVKLHPSTTTQPSFSLISRRLYLGLTYYLYPTKIAGKGCLIFSTTSNNNLPSNMKFSEIDGSIYGKLTGKFLGDVEVTCLNGDSQIKETVIYPVSDCPAYSVPYELKIKSTTDGGNIKIVFGSESKNLHIINGVPNSNEYVLSGCFQYDTYKLIIDSKNRLAWNNGTKIILSFGNIDPSEYSFNGGNQMMISDDISNKVVYDPKWMYSETYSYAWYNNFDMTIWNKIELSQIVKVGATTRFYKIIYESIVDYELLDTLLVTTTFSGGMVFYVNGNEVTRKDLPLQSDQTTNPLNNDLKSNYQFEVSGNLLRNGINYIGVEIHRQITSGNPINDDFRIEMAPLIGQRKCIAKTLFSTMSPKMTVEENLDGTADPNTIDLNYTTAFIGTTQSTTLSNKEIVYKYPDNIRKAFNEYSIVTTSECPNRDLKSWEILGNYLGDSTYTLLNSVTDEVMEGTENSYPGAGRSKIYSYKIMDSNKTYSAYKINMNEIKSLLNSAHSDCEGQYGFAEFYVSNCRELMCENDPKFPPTRIGTISYVSCERGKLGKYGKPCLLDSNNPKWGVESNGCTTNSPTEISYLNSTLNFAVGLYTEYNETSGDSKPGHLEIIGTIPNGIKIDDATGKIYGIPTSSSPTSEIHVLYDFLSGINLISKKMIVTTFSIIIFLIIVVSCEELNIDGKFFSKTTLGEKATMICKYSGGTYSRKCIVKDNKPEWGEEENNCGNL